MKIILLVLTCLATLLALVAVIGALLPRAHVASRAATYRTPPAALYAVVRAFDQAPAWRTGVKTVELLPPDAGRPAFPSIKRRAASPIACSKSTPAGSS